MIQNDWQRLYRHHGGLKALARCWRGTRRLKRGDFTPDKESMPGVDVMTFSVVPKMTALWSNWMRRAVDTQTLRINIGDCSGMLRQYLPGDDVVRVLPMLNYHHGEKLDLFLKHLCRTEYVIVTDDDIFWLDTEPWHWALEQLEKDPLAAVASIVPFKKTPDVLQGKVHLPMGSCFVIRRNIFTSEALSFKVDYSPVKEGKWMYDTGSKSQVQLIRRGYNIVYAPQDIQSHIIAFEGMSSWMLKMQKSDGDILKNISGDLNIRPAKAFRTILVAKYLPSLSNHQKACNTDDVLISSSLLSKVEAICRNILPSSIVIDVENEIKDKIDRLRKSKDHSL